MTFQPDLFRADGRGGWVTFRHETPDVPACGGDSPDMTRSCVLNPGHDGPHFDSGVTWTTRIHLHPSAGDTYTEEGGEAVWVRDEYTEPRETLFDCIACGRPVEDWFLFTCLSGGETLHYGCAIIHI